VRVFPPPTRGPHDRMAEVEDADPCITRPAIEMTTHMATSTNRRNRSVVTIVCKSLPHYRIAFFEALRDALQRHGVSLRVIYGEPDAAEMQMKHTADLAWGIRIGNYQISVGSRYLCWQPCLSLLRGTHLVIVEQASRLLLNYLLLAHQWFGGAAVAFWGHGRNFQDDDAGHLGEIVKRVVSRWPRWWFAYTERSASVVRSLPYPSDRITVVQNAIDTTQLQKGLAALSEDDIASFRARTGIHSQSVAIYAGGLYHEKRIAFLLDAARHLRHRVQNFELIIIGAGPGRALVEDAARAHTWIHYPGPVYGDEKLRHFRVSKVMLIPGLVGLGVLDSFALGVPLVTVDLPGHGPEIDYLCDGENAVKLPRHTDPVGYADVVAALMTNEARLEQLRLGGRAAAKVYTLEAMVSRFRDGVLRALAHSPGKIVTL
jgi:glycosyltransferase involved in cell wall biosynthesis